MKTENTLLTIKQKKLAIRIGFLLFGLLYFVAFTGLEVNNIAQNLLAIIPLEFLILIYYINDSYKKGVIPPLFPERKTPRKDNR